MNLWTTQRPSERQVIVERAKTAGCHSSLKTPSWKILLLFFINVHSEKFFQIKKEIYRIAFDKINVLDIWRFNAFFFLKRNVKE